MIYINMHVHSFVLSKISSLKNIYNTSKDFYIHCLNESLIYSPYFQQNKESLPVPVEFFRNKNPYPA